MVDPPLPPSFPAPLAPLAEQGAVLLGPLHEARRVRDWSLVLRSQEISHQVREINRGWVIVLDPRDLDGARRALRLYEQENANWPPRRARERPLYATSLVAPAALLVLVAFFLVTGPSAGGSAWFARGTAAAELVVGREPWRAITALTLHADATHVAGNVLAGAVFLGALQRRLGDGRALLATVVAGAAGNYANALWYRTGHASIGASTAVFAAVGLLVATQLVNDARAGVRRWTERVGPVVGGLLLLGAMGASPHSDLLAHLFGLLAGVVVGLLVALASRGRPTGRLRQLAEGLAAAGVVAASWATAWA